MPYAPVLTVRVDLAEVVDAVRGAVSEMLAKAAADRPPETPPDVPPMLAFDGATAARMLGGVCEKTLAKYPPERTGRFRLGTRVMYHAEKLKKFLDDLVEEQSKK